MSGVVDVSLELPGPVPLLVVFEPEGPEDGNGSFGDAKADCGAWSLHCCRAKECIEHKIKASRRATGSLRRDEITMMVD